MRALLYRNAGLLRRAASDDRYATRFALFVILVLSGIQLYYFDVTFHGPDQIRDMEVARELIHGGKWPVNGPPMFGERITLPPAFYYLLALPLLFRDSDGSVFLFFGILYCLSVIYLWRQVSRALGSQCGLVYAVLAFPLFPSIYAHSAWAPALIITFSNLLLGIYLKSIADKTNGWFALPIVFFLLVQVHPSAAPLLLGFAIYALWNPSILTNKATVVSLTLIMVCIAIWLLSGGGFHTPMSTGTPPAAPWAPSLWIDNIFNIEKWRDALLMPYHLVRGVRPTPPYLPVLSAACLAVMLAGLAISIIYIRRNTFLRWLWIFIILWFTVSMAFLEQGGFWHLDVVQPWLAVGAACGITQACHAMKGNRTLYSGIALLFAIVALSHATLYSRLNSNGKFDWLITSFFFPQPTPSENAIPTYSYRSLARLRDLLENHGICTKDIAGLETMAMREATLRYFDPHCPHTALLNKNSASYFIAPLEDTATFAFARGIHLFATIGKIGIFSPENIALTLNGKTTSNVHSRTKLNYMMYETARLEKGLEIALEPQAQQAILRVALRCSGAYPVLQGDFWNVSGATTTQPLTFSSRQYLNMHYYDLEWHLLAQEGHSTMRVASPPSPMNCDVSAIARATP